MTERVKAWFPDKADFEDLLEAAERKAERDYDVTLVAEFVELYAEWGTKMFLTGKQLEMLKKIAEV